MSSGRYAQSASRANPACIIFLLDQSYSMNNGIAGTPRPKIDALATGINRFLADLITLCEKGEEKPRNYFDVGVIGYTTDRSDPPNAIVGPVLVGEAGTLAGRDLVERERPVRRPAGDRGTPADGGRRRRRPDQHHLQDARLVPQAARRAR